MWTDRWLAHIPLWTRKDLDAERELAYEHGRAVGLIEGVKRGIEIGERAERMRGRRMLIQAVTAFDGKPNLRVVKGDR